jgi:hypothetical protein
MHEELKVGPETPIGSDDDVRANAAIDWNVATRVIDPPIGRIVVECRADLGDGGAGETRAKVLRWGGLERNQPGCQNETPHAPILSPSPPLLWARYL